jgi:hypothetical protein
MIKAIMMVIKNSVTWGVTAIPHAGLSMGGPYTIPMLISRGMVGYCPIITIIELRRFTGPHKSSMRSIHNQMLI